MVASLARHFMTNATRRCSIRIPFPEVSCSQLFTLCFSIPGRAVSPYSKFVDHYKCITSLGIGKEGSVDEAKARRKLSHPSDVDGGKKKRGRIICVTSGKGGVGKTTSAASFGFGLAQRGHKTCIIDFDIGLRNLDIHLGMERRVIFDFVNVLLEECQLNQALIKDRRQSNLYMLAASQTRDKDSLTVVGVEDVLAQLSSSFEFVVLDSPAGIESGARHAMYFADDAIIVTNPELSSCRDADKMVGFISSRSRRAELGGSVEPVSQTLLITRYDPRRVEAEESLSIADIEELLGLDVVGVIPESKAVLNCTNLGIPVVTLGEDDSAAGAYSDMVDRFLGEEKELRFVTPEPVSFFKRFFN